MDARMRFSTELQLLEANRLAWAKQHREEYVVIHGTEVVGFFHDFEQALEAGLRQYEMGEFLVNQVFEVEPVYAIF